MTPPIRTQPYSRRDVPSDSQSVPPFLTKELASVQRAIPVLSRVLGFGAAAPTSGTWQRGDIVFNAAPAAAGFIGWVCTTAGTPGTWKTWGVISV